MPRWGRRNQRQRQPSSGLVLERITSIATRVEAGVRNRTVSSDEALRALRPARVNFERAFSPEDPGSEDVLQSLDTAIEFVISLNYNNEQRITPAPVVRNGEKNGPRIDTNMDLLMFLVHAGIRLRTIVDQKMLGFPISVRTLRRRLREIGVQARQQFDSIPQGNLEDAVRIANERFPNSGYREVQSLLRFGVGGEPINVERARVAEVLRTVDPVGTARRWALAVPRRTYFVPCPNQLWHVDTNHALIRWRFVVTGGIDGCTSYITYLSASSNNRAMTTFRSFLSGVSECGLPTRVRADKGGELLIIRRFMEALFGENQNPFITGRSVHNVRIERLWRDVHAKVLSKYRRIFENLELHGLLKVDSVIDVQALHLTFMKSINEDLLIWKGAHNDCRMRTANGRSPFQPIVTGALARENSGYSAIQRFLDHNLDDFSREIAELQRQVNGEAHQDGEHQPHVMVETPDCHLSEDQEAEIRRIQNAVEMNATTPFQATLRILNDASVMYYHECS